MQEGLPESLARVTVNPSETVQKVKGRMDKETRATLLYEDNVSFDKPLVIRGTNKQFVPSNEMVSLEVPSNQELDSLIELCKGADDTLELLTLHNISEMEIAAVTDAYLVFKVGGEDKAIYFVMESPVEGSGGSKIAFKRFSTFLNIPSNFSSRNPGFLNKMNFEYWQKVLAATEEKKVPVDVVFQKTPFSISIDTDDGTKSIMAYLIVNLKKAKQTRGRASEVVESTLMERVPLFSKILSNIKDQMDINFPEMTPSLQSYSLGYTGGNKGNHYARIVFDGPGSQVEIGDDLFSLACSIETDFIGSNSNGSDLHVSFGLLREVCSNGMVVAWDKEHKSEIQKLYIQNYLKDAGISEDDEKYKELQMEAATKFSTLFSKEGFMVPVAMANAMFESSGFPQIFEFFKNSVEYFKKSIENLNIAFEDVVEKEFVDSSLAIANDLEMSQEVVKYFLIEYLAGNFQGQKQIFNTPLDILNFLTYICRSYTSEVQFDIERKAYSFAFAMAMVLIHKQKADTSSHSRLLNKVNPDLM